MPPIMPPIIPLLMPPSVKFNVKYICLTNDLSCDLFNIDFFDCRGSMSAVDAARLDALQAGVTRTPREGRTGGFSLDDSVISHSLVEKEKKTPARVKSKIREAEEEEGSDEDIMSIDEDDLPDAGAVASDKRASMEMDSADGIGEEGDIDVDGDGDEDEDVGVDAAASRDEDSERAEGTEDFSADGTAAEGEGEVEGEGEEEEGGEEEEDNDDEDDGSGIHTDSGTEPLSAPTTSVATPLPPAVITTVGE
jgi:hypothetical protein